MGNTRSLLYAAIRTLGNIVTPEKGTAPSPQATDLNNREGGLFLFFVAWMPGVGSRVMKGC